MRPHPFRRSTDDVAAKPLVGGYGPLPDLERTLILALIDRAIKVCEDFQP